MWNVECVSTTGLKYAPSPSLSLSFSLLLYPSLPLSSSLSLPPSPSLSLSLSLSLSPQSFGILISALVTATPTAIAIAVVSMLGSMLLGGFYVRVIPVWLKWAENLSFVTYAYDALLQLEFTEDSRFR